MGGALAPSLGKAPPPLAPPAGSHREYDVDDHLLSLAALAGRYGTGIDLAEPQRSRGLASAQLPALVARHGRNVLTPPKETPAWLQFLWGERWELTPRLAERAPEETAASHPRAPPPSSSFYTRVQASQTCSWSC